MPKSLDEEEKRKKEIDLENEKSSPYFLVHKELCEDFENEMQEKIYESFISFGNMTREQKLEHVEILSSLLEKQQVMYTRLSLSDDPKAIEMKENLRKSVSTMGFPPETDMLTLFSSMNATIKSLKDYIED
mgnify:CR=1 FL=1